ncbi:MAG: hypothetical protein IJA65_01695 [Acholeplasmatales bacterium]|nr:hypothetical protein [Acholeplasmatales bacterium]
MVIGKAHKDNLYLAITMFILLISGIITVGIVIIMEGNSIYNIIFSIISWIIALAVLIYAVVTIMLQLKTKDDIIICDLDNKQIIVNRYSKQIIININDIKEITYTNTFLFLDYTYGNINITLSNNEIIKTTSIDNVVEVCNELSNIVWK